MSGPIAFPRLVLLDGASAVGSGPSLGIQGDAIAFNVKSLFDMPVSLNVRLVDTVISPTATVIIEESNDILFGSGVTTWGTLSLVPTGLSASMRRTGVSRKVYIRARISVITGTAPRVSGYLRLGTG